MFVYTNHPGPVSQPPRIPRRAAAAAEIDALLAEIPTWDDHLLLHMHRRYLTSRLFRVRYDPQGELTPAARRLLITVEEEIARRALDPLPIDDDAASH